jgi:ADP-ribosyl-[dinitrogen reductase] hydrolase
MAPLSPPINEMREEMKNSIQRDGTEFTSLLAYPHLDAELGGLVGLLVGDAVGVSYEFNPPDRLPLRDQIDMVPPRGFVRSHPTVPPGTWSDDGAQAICLLASLVECGEFDIKDFSGKLLSWMMFGYMAVDRNVFDVGMQTSKALRRIQEDGVPPELAGGAGERDNGNGSLMRVLPLALWHRGSNEDLVRLAHTQSLPTHRHPRSEVVCALYCLVARAYLQRHTDPWTWADTELERVYSTGESQDRRHALMTELQIVGDFPRHHKPSGTGYAVDALWSARQALQEKTFEDVVRSAIAFGNDTDTTACIAGGLAGIKFGLSEIPSRWLRTLRGFDNVQNTVGLFIAHLLSHK